ncbi:MAG TPA: protein kinase [Gemmatimonadales bacterium]|nr:protein kinase [Gemmatimonadales bacterium]
MSERLPGTGADGNADRIEELYERAVQLTPAERMAFLEQACDGDRQLLQELRSLLEHREAAETFFRGLADSVTSPAIGEQVHQYQLTGILGTGGMGTVYRAHDTRLGRVVALKFLPPYLSANPESRERFLVEARAAAALEHPNVCSIHEIGETTDGRPFIAMACYDGETLKERLRRGPLPPAEALDIAIQLARGLGAAHARSIVHRDVKPGNIMLTTDGTVRLLDFGVAKVADVSLTSPGATPGTIAYMSPEQARGETVGPATDLWSLGVVLYEMLAGVRPFRGGNDRTVIQSILHAKPDLAHGPLRDATSGTLRVIDRLLRKSPGDRFHDAGELLEALTHGAPSSATERALGWARRHPRSLAACGAALLGLIALGALGRSGWRSATAAPAANESAQPVIAVLPFSVRGAGLDVWREGMVDLLSMGLDGAAGLRAVDSRTLLASWHQEMRSGSSADLARALAVARRTGAHYALVGSVIGAGPQLRLAADLYDTRNAKPLGPVQVDGPSDSVLVLVDRLGMQTLGLILEKDAREIPTLNLAAITTSSLSALKAYLDGDEQYRRSEFRAASDAWERAVRADSLFALAYLGLSDSYSWYDFDSYQRNTRRAHQLEARLPERERIKAQIRWARFSQDRGALSIIKEAIRRYPDAADAWYELGEVYFHDAAAMGGPEQVDSAFRKAAELQPTMAPYRVHLLHLAFLWHPDSARIAEELEAYSRLAPDEPQTQAARIAFALAFSDSAGRAAAQASLRTLDPGVLVDVYDALQHPRFADVRRALLPLIEPRIDERHRPTFIRLRLFNLGLVDGRLREGLAILADPSTPAIYRTCGPIYYEARGLPVPVQALEMGLAAGQADTSQLSGSRLRCTADYAARFGDWNTHAALLARAHAMAARAFAAGDTVRGRDWLGLAIASEGYGLLRRGRKAAALRKFEDCLYRSNNYGVECVWFVGQLALELGKLDEAEQAFRALWNQRDGAPARMQLARILERRGRSAEALEAYRYVAYAWRNADPELQPVVAEARLAIQRLSAVAALAAPAAAANRSPQQLP